MTAFLRQILAVEERREGAGLLGARAGVFQYHPCGERASGNRALLKSIVANHRAGHPTPALCARFPLPSLIPVAAVQSTSSLPSKWYRYRYRSWGDLKRAVAVVK